MKWQCALFDLDGTLVDSEALNCRAYPDLIPEITDELEVLMQRYRGQQFTATLQDIEQRYKVKLPDDFETLYRSHLDHLFTSELKPIPRVKEVLEALDIPCCVASNAPQKKIRHALEVTGLSQYFGESLFSAYDVNAWKPKPDLFLYAAQQMGFEPADCVVFEDTELGVAAAKAAGMAVFHYFPHGERKSEDGYECVQDMGEVIRLLSG